MKRSIAIQQTCQGENTTQKKRTESFVGLRHQLENQRKKACMNNECYYCGPMLPTARRPAGPLSSAQGLDGPRRRDRKTQRRPQKESYLKKCGVLGEPAGTFQYRNPVNPHAPHSKVLTCSPHVGTARCDNEACGVGWTRCKPLVISAISSCFPVPPFPFLPFFCPVASDVIKIIELASCRQGGIWRERGESE